MLIGEIMEKTPSVTAAENMASRLADRIRNIWLENVHAGVKKWEENFYEDPDGIAFLRSEAFPNLQGIDYIFQWWGGDGAEAAAGQLEVLWKVKSDSGMDIYKTSIRFADRDFVAGPVRDESRRREQFRSEFQKAFAIWQKLYIEHVS